MKLLSSVIIIIFLVIAFLLRFYNPLQVPPSLNWDEASLGYNAYSILKTGKDEWGRMLPLTFEAFGDYKLPVYIYSLVPFIGLFGLESWVVRLPSYLGGILSALILYFIVKELTQDKKWAIFSGILLAISSWHIFLSRIALEANLALFIFLLGLYFFLKGFKNYWYFSLSSILFGLTVFTYNSARVFIPLFLLILLGIYYKRLLLGYKKLLLPVGILFIFVAIAGYLAIFQDSSSRYYWVTIIDTGAISFLEEARNTSSLPSLINVLVYNRYSYFLYNFILNYLSHFSLDFLFLKGGSNYQFSIPSQGLLYLFELPFILVGIYSLIKKKDLRLLIFGWLLIAPIASSLTREAPHALRAIFMLGSLQIIGGLGVVEILNIISRFKVYTRGVIVGVFVLLSLINIGIFGYKYFEIYPKKYSQSWQYGMKNVYQELDQVGIGDKKIYITKHAGEPHIFYLFYTKYDPAKYQNNPTLLRYEKTNWRWVDRLDNITFVNDWDIKEKLKDEENYILVTTPGNYPEGDSVIKRINYLDGSKAFEVIKH